MTETLPNGRVSASDSERSPISLALVVVYFVPPENDRLLTLHLDQISRHTNVPYTIFGVVTRLSPESRRSLEEHPRVRLCNVEPTAATGGEEHAYYLDRLTGLAIESGATHVASLHVDSFPVRSTWVEVLTARLSDRCPVLTGDRIDSGCLMFTRDFYLRCRPAFRLTDADRRRPEYSRYVAEWFPNEHTGVGYAFAAYVEGSDWPLSSSRHAGLACVPRRSAL